jgi:hypothetical protein
LKSQANNFLKIIRMLNEIKEDLYKQLNDKADFNPKLKEIKMVTSHTSRRYNSYKHMHPECERT